MYYSQQMYFLLNQWRNISFHMWIKSNKNPSICVETLIGSCWDRYVRRTAQSIQNWHSFLSSWQITSVQRSSVAETTLRALPTTMPQDRPQLIVLTGQARAIFSGMNYPLQPQSEVLRRAALAFLRVQQWGGEAAAILDSWLDHCCRHAWVLVNICWGIAFNSRYIWAITMSSNTLFWPSFCCNKDEISFHLWTLQTCRRNQTRITSHSKRDHSFHNYQIYVYFKGVVNILSENRESWKVI